MEDANRRPKRHGTIDDLKGASQLVVGAVVGITNVVESMHRNIGGLAPILGRGKVGRTTGITGFVYRRIRDTTNVVGTAIDAALGPLAKVIAQAPRSPERTHIRSALNGLFGEYLSDQENPLAIDMSLYADNEMVEVDRGLLARRFGASKSKVPGRIILMVHGLCMNDLQWAMGNHDHRVQLEHSQHATILSMHYNTGRRVVDNGADLARLLDTLVTNWPAPVVEIVMVCHSMGGLVARSALALAAERRLGWRSRLSAIVFLGTPHLGAPLERGGARMLQFLSASPYTAPIASVGLARSAGIMDLRYGFQEKLTGELTGARAKPPKGIRYLLVAATESTGTTARGVEPKKLRSDGLVPHASAHGLDVGQKDRVTFYKTNHFELLASPAVCDKINEWLHSIRRS